jgi:hypothetical protein
MTERSSRVAIPAFDEVEALALRTARQMDFAWTRNG